MSIFRSEADGAIGVGLPPGATQLHDRRAQKRLRDELKKLRAANASSERVEQILASVQVVDPPDPRRTALVRRNSDGKKIKKADRNLYASVLTNSISNGRRQLDFSIAKRCWPRHGRLITLEDDAP